MRGCIIGNLALFFGGVRMISADKIDFTMTDEEFNKLLDELKILLELREEGNI